MKKLLFIIFTATVSAVSLLVAQFIFKVDPAAGIANFLHLGHGAVVAALLAGLLTLWLVLGTAKRLADFGGWQLGVLAGVLFWQWANSMSGVLKPSFVLPLAMMSSSSPASSPSACSLP